MSMRASCSGLPLLREEIAACSFVARLDRARNGAQVFRSLRARGFAPSREGAACRANGQLHVLATACSDVSDLFFRRGIDDGQRGGDDGRAPVAR